MSRIVAFGALAVLVTMAESVQALTLGIRGSSFTLNGRPAFLLGASYYGALGASDAVWTGDLAELHRLGYNWIRVWATWTSGQESISAVGLDGQPREPFLNRLRHLVDRCDRLGIVVDVTLSRGQMLPSYEAHRIAVLTIIRALKRRRNWYLDLANEHDVRDARYIPMDEVARLREVARLADPSLLVTASHGGDIVREELAADLRTARLDFITPHRPRDAGSPGQTEQKTREYLAWMHDAGRIVPVLYQEPFRRGYGNWQPAMADYLADLRGAIAGGAAGWCFHNGSDRNGARQRSFDLRHQSLFEQLDSVEREAIAAAGRAAHEMIRQPRR